MPAKAASKMQSVTGDNASDISSTATPRRSQDSRSQDNGSIDGRSRRKLKKSPAASPKVAQSWEASGDEKEGRGLFGTKRRQSIRNPKVPQGARPMATTQAKQTTANAPLQQNRSIPINTKVPRSRQSSIGGASHFSFGSKGQDGSNVKDLEQSTTPFLPPVNFDELHESITLGDFGDLEFNRPADVLPPKKQPSMPNLTASDGTIRKFSLDQPPKTADASRHSRTNSFARPLGTNLRQPSNSSIKSSGAAPPVTMQTQQPRRQSYFYTAQSMHNSERAPRKSVGPGTFAVPQAEQMSVNADRLPKPDRSSTDPDRQIKPRDGSGNKPARLSLAPSTEQSVLGRARDAKAKSMQSPPKMPGEFLQTDPSTPDSPWSSVLGTKSPGREAAGGQGTPLSAKRMSLHATGLGARTVSPTDARRAKRLSMMPNAPPVPQTPPDPLPEPQRALPRSTVDSPSLIPRKSVTPSSNRTTPDHNRKSYSSGVSISSNTSFNSLKNQAPNARLQQNSASSRLPTLKTRTDTTSTNGEEIVPPVPAIPKAFDSPKDTADVAFPSARKSSIPYDSLSVNSSSTLEYTTALSSTSSEKDAAKADQTPRQRTTGALTNMELAEEERAAGIQDGRRSMQPLRIPINMNAEKTVGEYSSITPPPRKGPPKTPSTPMTASKTTFFTRNRKEETAPMGIQNRSNSSHFALRHESSTNFRAPSSSNSSVRPAGEIRQPRKVTSPFVSSSLPKSSGEFTRRTPNGDRSASNVSTTARSSKLTGPRAQTATKTTKPDSVQHHHSPSDTEATSFGNSIRRKLSLTRRRSSSKVEQPHQPSAEESMPPPKLPASATMNSVQPQTQTQQKHSFLHSRRKSSAPDAFSRPEQRRTDDPNANGKINKDSKPSFEARSRIVSAKASESNIRRFNSNSSIGSLKLSTVDTKLDAQDIAAEEEMVKLASKRKKTELEARELDELRRRAVPRDRVSPSQALRAARLNMYERGEIVDFKDIYFCGTSDAKKFAGNLESESANFGYDDDRGDYNIVLGDHFSYRYEVVDVLGKGSFGQVVRCVDHKTGGLVAIKIIRNKKRFHQQALVEVNILQKLREWDPMNKYSMVTFVQSFYFRGHLCISTELLGMNLYEFIKIHDFRGFSLKLIRRFTKQLLNSLVLLKSHKVIHCDLKPENILLTHPARSEIKVIDFGSSCLENEKVYTYIQSRFYRSPEVILGMSYGMPIDMWSLGCILAELLTGYPIFPGENEQEQLACIMEVFGPPDKHLIEKSTRKKLFFDSLGKPRLTVSSKGKRRRPSSKTLSQALKCDDELFLDFLTRCLRWDPERRMKPDEAAHHEFITGIKPAANLIPTSATRNLRSVGGPTSTLHTSVSTSPIKRLNSVHAPGSGPRPLPEPPGTAVKNVTPVALKTGPSPSKAAPKRHSTVTATSSTFSSSRKGPGPPPSANLPKITGARIASGKSDLASAAAAAATTKQRL